MTLFPFFPVQYILCNKKINHATLVGTNNQPDFDVGKMTLIMMIFDNVLYIAGYD